MYICPRLTVLLTNSRNTYLSFLRALYDSLSDKGHVLVLGDFNGDLGDSLGDKGKYPPNQRGSKLLDFTNYFNICPANLLKLQLHDAIYRLRFYSNSLTHFLLLSNSHNDTASIQKNRGNKSHRVIVA